jgi:uncharacterized protein DUF6081
MVEPDWTAPRIQILFEITALVRGARSGTAGSRTGTDPCYPGSEMTRTPSPTRTYDDYLGSDLDMSRWFFLEYPPGPDGNSWRCEEPSARTEVGEGRLDIRVERFEREHDQVAIMDNPKHLLLSTEAFPVPADAVVSFSMDLAVTSINANARDYRDGFAAFNVLDMTTGWVFDACASGDTIFAIHERLPMPGVEQPFTHVVEAPLSGVVAEAGRRHTYTISLDAANGAAEWRVDDTPIYHLRGAEIPSQVNVGLGLFTLHPITDGRSTSVHGQGIAASFGPISVAVGTDL